jgi:hypothetical protein
MMKGFVPHRSHGSAGINLIPTNGAGIPQQQLLSYEFLRYWNFTDRAGWYD